MNSIVFKFFLNFSLPISRVALYCIFFFKSSKKFVKKIVLYCFRKKIDEKFCQKNWIVLFLIFFLNFSLPRVGLYCIVFEKKLSKKFIKKIRQKNCIVLFLKNKLTKKFVKKIELYCIVFEKKIKKIALYCIGFFLKNQILAC